MVCSLIKTNNRSSSFKCRSVFEADKKDENRETNWDSLKPFTCRSMKFKRKAAKLQKTAKKRFFEKIVLKFLRETSASTQKSTAEIATTNGTTANLPTWSCWPYQHDQLPTSCVGRSGSSETRGIYSALV